MNILVTGGSGFLGQALIKALLAEGHKISVLTRSKRRAARLFDSNVMLTESLDDWPVTPAFDAVINLAGEGITDKRWSARRKRLIYESRVDLTRELVDFLASLEAKPNVLISGSAVGFYGNQSGQFVDENTQPHDEFTHRLCADWEAEAQRAERYGIRVCLLRTGLVLGPEGGILKKMLPPFKLGLGGQFGSGEHWMPWIHLDDWVALTLFLLNHKTLRGPFNATAPLPVNNAEFTRQLAQLVGKPARLNVPGVVLKLAMGESSCLLLTGQHALPVCAERAGFEFTYRELEPALRACLFEEPA